MVQIAEFKPSSHNLKALVYGQSGHGKTTFGATCPKPVFASAEGGLLSIARHRPHAAVIKTIRDLADLHKQLAAGFNPDGSRNGKHDYETVVIDSITEISEIIKAGIEKETRKPMQMQDWGTLAREIRKILTDFRDLPMHVLFIALEKAEKDEERIVRFAPDLQGRAATDIVCMMDIVGHLTIDANGERKIFTQPMAKYLTKDRTGLLKGETTPDFSLWVEKARGLEIGESKVIHEGSQAPAEKPGFTNEALAKLEAAAGKYESADKLVDIAAVKYALTAADEASIRAAFERAHAPKEAAEAEAPAADAAQEEAVAPVGETLKAVAKTEAAAGDRASKAQLDKLLAAWNDPALPAMVLENRKQPEILLGTLERETGREGATLESLTPTEAEAVISNILDRNVTLIDNPPATKAAPAKKTAKAEKSAPAPKAEAKTETPVGKPVDNGHVQGIKDFLALLSVGMDDATKVSKLRDSITFCTGVKASGATVDEVISGMDAAARAKTFDFLRERYNAKSKPSAK